MTTKTTETTETTEATEATDPFIGKYVLCRCNSAGVHTGTLLRQEGDIVDLKDSRRLWSWTAKNGVALSGVAQTGLSAGKIDTVNPLIRLTGVIEVIVCSDSARGSIHNF
jgi:hypothetical protein